MAKYRQGTFKPKNPEKYKGDFKNIKFRSGWELQFMFMLDANPNIIQWSSEEIVIPYISPLDGQWHRYFMDFYIKKKTSDGKIVEELIEIKPYSQTKEPKVQNKKTRRYITEVTTYAVNDSKWKYAKEYCKKKGWNFLILTEKELGIK